MIKRITSITHWLASKCNSIMSWLESEDIVTNPQSKFVDLAPTDAADKAGIYSEAIMFAAQNTKVSNIALTGPYGSGKSSIIQSFLKKYQRPTLHISLASFVSEADSNEEKVSRQEIERSILQQILYGADSNKLPLSRFKRIQSPGFFSFLKSLYIMLGVLAFWYVCLKRDDIISGYFFLPITFNNWLNLVSLPFALVFFWSVVHHFYIASFGLSLKSISLKDVEIKPACDDQASILNRHLDEIIYFFQATKYELVIIEDLDRFNNAEIFITLREINSLINENSGVKRHIKFLYALRDDMFVNTERTKFFEFIIPVIPIINTSNSIDMVLKQEKRLKLDERLDRQFLREVSRYLNDLRLIQNIFNEYAIYSANLETDGDKLLDANKLLAILIYKNVYPKDFEELHRGMGCLAEILNCQNKLIKSGEASYRDEIVELEKQLKVAEQQIYSNQRELRQIYAMALVEKLPLGVRDVSFNNESWSTLAELVNCGEFEQLIEASSIFYRNINNIHYPCQFDISKLQDEVNSEISYLQRKKDIELKATDGKNKIWNKISELKQKISVLRTSKLNELLHLNFNSAQEYFDNFADNSDLARFLILEGYIDDTYYQYTSLFHSGRLSPNDNKFLIQIRAFVTPEPNFLIDNPIEVIAAMRKEDFRQSYVLNVKIVDTLFSDCDRYSGQIKKLLELISSRFDSCEDFFDAYYTSGREIENLLWKLSNFWDGLIPSIVTSTNNISHVCRLISSLPVTSLKALASDFIELPKFVSMNLPQILSNVPELTSERLVCLNFEVKDLAGIKEHSEIVGAMFESERFELTIENIEYIYQAILGEKNLEQLHERNFTTILSTNNTALINKVECNFGCYVRDILLALEKNSKEDASTILSIIQHDELEEDELRTFLEKQTTKLPFLQEAPESVFTLLFELKTIKPTWENCLTFMTSDGFEEDVLIEFLNDDDIRQTILQHPIPEDNGTQSQKLRNFFFKASSLSDSAYREYAHVLPNKFTSFPSDFEPSKLQILIDEKKVTFTKESLDALGSNIDLQVMFTVINIDAYLKEPKNFEFDDNFIEKLLLSKIKHSFKLKIVKLMDLRAIVGLPERSALIGLIIQNPEIETFDLDADILRSLINYSKSINTKISLLNIYNDCLNNHQLSDILSNLPEPFSEIKTGYRTPKIKNTPENLELVKLLKSREMISSWRVADMPNGTIKVNLFRKHELNEI